MLSFLFYIFTKEKKMKVYKFIVKYIDKNGVERYRIDREFSTYLAGAIRKWQQNHDNASIVGFKEA